MATTAGRCRSRAGGAAGATVARGVQVGAGAMTTAATTALAVRVAANPIGLAIGKGDADLTQTEETSEGCGDDGFKGVAA